MCLRVTRRRRLKQYDCLRFSNDLCLSQRWIYWMKCFCWCSNWNKIWCIVFVIVVVIILINCVCAVVLKKKTDLLFAAKNGLFGLVRIILLQAWLGVVWPKNSAPNIYICIYIYIYIYSFLSIYNLNLKKKNVFINLIKSKNPAINLKQIIKIKLTFDPFSPSHTFKILNFVC